MKSRWAVGSFLAGLLLGWQSGADALTISFLEPASGTGNIVVNVLDLSVPAVVSTSPEAASVTVGTATEASTLVARVGLIQPGSMHMEGGGMGVSDVLELRTFLSTGFRVSFQSDGETGIPNPGGFTAPLIVETGLPQTLLSGTFTLPVVGSVALTVNGQSDLDPVPEPATMVLFGTALTGVGIAVRRRGQRRE